MGQPAGLRDAATVLLVGIHDQVPEQEVHELHGHDVEHDGTEYFTDIKIGFQGSCY